MVITGSTSGIGKALAICFAEHGSKVVINGRNKPRLDQIADQIKESGGVVLPITGDVSVEADCKNLIEETINTFGKIDILINNAGISMRTLFAETDLDVIKKVMNINFWGTVYCTRYALSHILHTRGSIVGISSIAGKKGLPGRTGYSASKFAMEGFLESLRLENYRTGIHVLVACPGFTASSIRENALDNHGNPQHESPRDEMNMMSSEETALHIYNAIRSRKRDLLLTRQGKLTIFLDKFFPKLVDKLTFKHISKEPGSPF